MILVTRTMIFLRHFFLMHCAKFLICFYMFFIFYMSPFAPTLASIPFLFSWTAYISRLLHISCWYFFSTTHFFHYCCPTAPDNPSGPPRMSPIQLTFYPNLPNLFSQTTNPLFSTYQSSPHPTQPNNPWLSTSQSIITNLPNHTHQWYARVL